MKKKNKKNRWIELPKLKLKWLGSWLLIQPLAAAPLVLIVAKWGPFAEPFVANGPVVLPALLFAVAPILMLIHGSGMLDPVPRNED
jgi:hypothetical protein